MNTYSIVLAFHVISIATWMLMLIYLPKLFVYHINAPTAAKEVIALQEANLFKIGTVAMIFSIKFGLILLYLNPHLLNSGGWLHLKLTLVGCLVLFHVTCKKLITQLKLQDKEPNLRFFKLLRMFPEIATSIIILLTIIKPF